MFRHILLPVDGSALSRQAATAGVELARECGASVSALHVVPPLQPDLLEAWAHHDPDYAAKRRAIYEEAAVRYLDFVSNRAAAEHVPCATLQVEAAAPADAILRTARQLGCDLIYLASHGWGQQPGAWLGSVSLRVLQAAPVPVLVYRPHAS